MSNFLTIYGLHAISHMFHLDKALSGAIVTEELIHNVSENLFISLSGT
ncbi:hypothetical protein [Pedobacter sp. KBS0701]|nr:hypothetical protein [Pedobacter sp. KBS0701]